MYVAGLCVSEWLSVTLKQRFGTALCGGQEMIEVHKGREDKQAKAQATARANSLVECQPNTGAPLLRDEKARRDWVERELDICCQVGASLPSSAYLKVTKPKQGIC